MNPPIFVSATSGDLGEARDLVVSVLTGMGYQTRVQPTFPFTGGDLRTELRRLIDDCGMMIQLVGFRCGRMSTVDDPEFGRASHTQYEARYAEKRGMRVLYVTLPKAFPFSPCDSEPDDLVVLQRDYRESLRSRGDQRGTPANPDALRALILQMRDDLGEALKLATERHAEIRQDLRWGFDEVKSIFAALRADLATGGRKLAELSLEELKGELARRTPHMTLEKLQRLIGYALFEADISQIDKHAPAALIGRNDELKILNDAWEKVVGGESMRPHILTFVALGGEGKTSLVAKWAADLAHQDWPGCDAAFAWSFYSQGTREEVAASSDLFLKEALIFFGDKVAADGAQSSFEKGRRLAQMVGERRALLILDGLEPLQYGPASPTAGELKDQGLMALLKGLAASNHGLCIVTTRYTLPDLKTFWQSTAPEIKLLRLSLEAGVSLLGVLGVKGAQRRLPENSIEIDQAISGLRRSGNMDYLPRGLLIRAWFRSMVGAHVGSESALADLDEAWEISERGSMRLHMADIHLSRARLFGRKADTGKQKTEMGKYPWESVEKDLGEARRLIEECGYWRRKEELEDAERALLGG